MPDIFFIFHTADAGSVSDGKPSINSNNINNGSLLPMEGITPTPCHAFARSPQKQY